MSRTLLTKQGFIKLMEELAHIRFIDIPAAERMEDKEEANERLEFYQKRIEWINQTTTTAKILLGKEGEGE